jgi:rhodanese-related sulfurtransferase
MIHRRHHRREITFPASPPQLEGAPQASSLGAIVSTPACASASEPPNGGKVVSILRRLQGEQDCPVPPELPAEPLSQVAQFVTDLLASLQADPELLNGAVQFLLSTLKSLQVDPKPLSGVAQRIAGLLASLQGTGGEAPSPGGSPGPNVYQAVVPEKNQKTQQVNTDDMVQILAQHSAIVFDSRTRLEYSIGHLPGALSLSPKPGAPKSQYVGDVAEVARIVPDRNAPLVLYCNGPFCGKSRRLAEELVTAGYADVRRYQLGTPGWRALVGPMEVEVEGIRYIRKGDQTAVFLDARSPEQFASGSLPGARNVQVNDIAAAKSDGRLPMDDFNTRVIIFGQDGTEALGLAEALAHTGFNNVKFYGGTFASLLMVL